MMNDRSERRQTVSVVIDPNGADAEAAQRLKRKFDPDAPECCGAGPCCDLTLRLDPQGLALVSDGQALRGDFTRMLPRLKRGNLSGELLVRAARIKDPAGPLTAVDATAGLGEDSLLLAAAGFRVTLYERNPIVYELLYDALRRARQIPELADIVERMQVFPNDSIHGMQRLDTPPDVILLDPMFPPRQKSSLVKKKLQMIQKLELPCEDEEELIMAAISARPKKLVVKRPPKGPFLAGIKPDYSLTGQAVRFDCIVSPYDKIQKFKK